MALSQASHASHTAAPDGGVGAEQVGLGRVWQVRHLLWGMAGKAREGEARGRGGLREPWWAEGDAWGLGGLPLKQKSLPDCSPVPHPARVCLRTHKSGFIQRMLINAAQRGIIVQMPY